MESEDRKPIFTKRLILIILAVILIALIIFLLLRKCGNNSGVSSDLSVELSAYSLNLKVGDVYNISATTHPENQVVTWSSDNQLVAAVDANGSIYAQSVGVAVITATASNGKEANCFVTVSNNFPELTGILLDKTKYTLKVGGLTIASVTPQPEGAQTPMLNYVVANTSVATIDQSGVIRGVSAGTTTLTVSTQDGKFQASAVIIVTDKTSGNTGNNTGSTTLKPVSVELTGGTSKTLTVGETYVIPFKVNPADAEQAVVCTSSSSSIAKVNDCKVTAVAAGSTTIKVCSKQNTKICTQLSITVKAKSSGSGSGNTGGNGGNTGGNTGTNITKDDIPKPKVSFRCGGTQYIAKTWCNSNVNILVEKPTAEIDVDTFVTCVSTGSAECTPRNYSTLAGAPLSGSYNACAAYVKDGVIGNISCTGKTEIQIDKTAPKCIIRQDDGYYIFTATDQEPGSGIDKASATINGNSVKLSGTNQYSAKGIAGTTYTCAVKDNAGNSYSDSYTFINVVNSPSFGKVSTVWSTEYVSAKVSVDAGEMLRVCQGKSKCTPNQLVANGVYTAKFSENGTYYVCAERISGDSKSEAYCEEYKVETIDRTQPTCSISKSGNKLTLTASDRYGELNVTTATIKGSLNVTIGDFKSGYVYSVKSTGAYVFSIEDKAGNKCTSNQVTVSPDDLPKPSEPNIVSSSDLTKWTNGNVTISISSATPGATIKACYTTNGNTCTNYATRAGGTITITVNGTYNVCAIAEKDGIKSSPRCQDFQVSKIDKTNPTCDLSLLNGKSPVKATVTETDSGIASVSSGWTNPAPNDYRKAVSSTAGTHTFSFKVSDNAGNQGSCSTKVKVSKSCPEGYSIIEKYSTSLCLKYYGPRPWGEWDSGTISYVAEKPSSYVTKETSSITKAYAYSISYSTVCSNNNLPTPCYKKVTYTRSRNGACPTGTNLYNGSYCYLTKSQVTTYTEIK